MSAEAGRPPWTVTLVCGASGVGKSRLAVPLAVRYGVPLAEPDEDRIVANYAAREPQWPEQRNRARVSVLIGARFAGHAREAGMPVVETRPWLDVLDRVDGALRAWRR